MVTAAETMGGQRMTKARAEALTEPGRYPEGTVTGLFLRIAPGGSKQWIQRVRINGVRVDKGLGPFPRVGIAEARNLAERNRALIHAGDDPWAGKQQDPRSGGGVGVGHWRPGAPCPRSLRLRG